MFAEITIVSKKDLPQDLVPTLTSRLGRSASLEEAVKASALADNPGVRQQVIFAGIEASMVYLVQSPERQMIKIHVESVYEKGDLQALKRSVADISSRLKRYLRFIENGSSSLRVEVWAENEHLMSGMELSIRKRLQGGLTENLYTEVYIAAFILLYTGLFGQDLQQAALNFLVALTAILLFFIFQAVFHRGDLDYREG